MITMATSLSSLLLSIVLLASLQLWLNAGGVEAVQHIGQVVAWDHRPQLWQDHTLFAGESMVNEIRNSASQILGTLTLKMQTDCNLVVYGVPDGQAMWSSKSDTGSSTCHLNMQTDGNLVIYDNGAPVWASKTAHGPASGPYFLVAQNDGNVVIYGNRQSVWATGTVFPGSSS